MTFVLAVLMMAIPGKTADACEGPFVRQGVLSDVRPGLPNREAVRVIGVVMGYGSVTRAIGKRMDVDRAATLRIRVREVVSGRIANGDREIVPLGYSASCSSVGETRDWVEETYKIGTSVVVFGESIPGFSTSSAPAILAESHQGGFVAMISGNLPRVATGELDFGRLDNAHSLGRVLWFEFDRADNRCLHLYRIYCI